MSKLESTIFLAQNFDQGGAGSGGVEDVTGAIDDLTGTLTTVGGSIAALAFIGAILWFFFKVWKGEGGIGQAFGPVMFVLLGAVALGLGTVAVGWFIGIGESLG